MTGRIAGRIQLRNPPQPDSVVCPSVPTMIVWLKMRCLRQPSEVDLHRLSSLMRMKAAKKDLTLQFCRDQSGTNSNWTNFPFLRSPHPWRMPNYWASRNSDNRKLSRQLHPPIRFSNYSCGFRRKCCSFRWIRAGHFSGWRKKRLEDITTWPDWIRCFHCTRKTELCSTEMMLSASFYGTVRKSSAKSTNGTCNHFRNDIRAPAARWKQVRLWRKWKVCASVYKVWCLMFTVRIGQVETALTDAHMSGVLSLTLALGTAHLSPVVRAIRYQQNLWELNLPSTKMDDTVFKVRFSRVPRGDLG